MYKIPSIKYILLFTALFLSATANAQFHIIPQPVSLKAGAGSIVLGKNAIIGVNKETEPVGRYLQDYLNQNYGFQTTVKVYEQIPAKTPISLNNVWSNQEGAYTMHVSTASVSISGNGAGVFYGVQSLIQLLPTDKGVPLKVAACTIADQPRFGWRGLSLDVSRHFFTVDEVKKYIDVMAHYKLNTFHWHLTDDEGWRIQIDKYPKLTEVGSKISYYAKRGEFRKLDNLVDEGRDGFYTKDEIRDVIKYAQDRFVTILPEIEMPGHSEAAIFAYPQLGCQDSTGAKHRVRMLDPSEYTFKFMEDVLTEVIELFPNQYVHIGGDEAEMVDWLKSPTAVALMKREHLKSEKEVQSYFIKRIEKFLLSKNKRLVGWDEILQGGLAESATVMSWQGEAGGIAAAKMRHHVVMTPLPYMYFDAPQANEDLEPIGWNPPVTWQMVYNYEPQSKELTNAEAEYILGAQGNIWNEKVPNAEHLQYMVYPRALAVAELTWSPKNEKNLDRFGWKMKNQYGLFKLWNFNARLPDIDGIDDVVTNKSRFALTLNYPLKGAKVRYNLNGKMPDANSASVAFPVKINVPLKDSIGLRTFTTWTLNDQHIRQTANIKRVVIKSAHEKAANLKPGMAYEIFKTRERDFTKLENEKPFETGITNLIVAVKPVTEEYINWVKIKGFIKIDKEADYELTTGFEETPALFVDDVEVIKPGFNTYVEPQKALLHLKKGVYALSGHYVAGKANENQSLIELKVAGGEKLYPKFYLVH
ncbi:beta-N-acetylhexosaminidase [Mucilaginibacter sp. CAU 1740]|uniref:beta-N-acetylhexosaminidase n=1 Tax=Mucilaginibacter sp. CAU 1740 TaxID=3140365 RepID=UPI00325BA850